MLAKQGLRLAQQFYLSEVSLNQALLLMVKAVRYQVNDDQTEVRFIGGDTKYHDHDPTLERTVKAEFGLSDTQQIDAWRKSEPHWDICFEDCWSGWFVSQWMNSRANQPLVFIHLDHHTDMMNTLMLRDADVLKNPMSGEIFNHNNCDHWEQAINCGAISIGNFVTPLFYASHKCHVRHVSNNPLHDGAVRIVRHESVDYDVVPEDTFAGIRVSESASSVEAGSLASSIDAELVLADLPEGQVIVHIDLDYFINDYDGDPGSVTLELDDKLKHEVNQKMMRFFSALKRTRRTVDRWIIATSPGFCAATHWPWLLDSLRSHIDSLTFPSN